MKFKVTTKTIVPATEKAVQIETSFEFETDIFDEVDNKESKEEHSYIQITDGYESPEISEEEVEEVEEELSPLIGFQTANDNRKRREIKRQK
jgi:hypothetical protein